MGYTPILIRDEKGTWVKTEQVDFANEEELQNLLFASPELIERTTAGALVFAKESAVAVGCFADLIGVTSGGEIILVETKLARNPEIRRKVIGQILEYAAFLWQMDYITFNNLFVKSNERTIVESLASLEPDVDQDSLRSAVEENLRSGRFLLLIAVDEITHELDKILSYISSRGDGLQLEALAVRIYKQGQTQVLVPKRYGGRQNLVSQPRSAPKKLTIEQIVTNAQDEHMRVLLSLIVERWRGDGLFVDPGTVGFSCKANIGEKTASMFWATPTEYYGLQPNFASLDQLAVTEELKNEIRRSVAELNGFPADKCARQSYVTVKFAAITESTMEDFIRIMHDAVTQARKEVSR